MKTELEMSMDAGWAEAVTEEAEGLVDGLLGDGGMTIGEVREELSRTDVKIASEEVLERAEEYLGWLEGRRL